MYYGLYLKALCGLQLKAITIHSTSLAKGKELNEHKTTALKSSKDCCLNSEHHPPSKLCQQPPCNKISFTEYIFQDVRSSNKLIENETSKECGSTAQCLYLPTRLFSQAPKTWKKLIISHFPTPLKVISSFLMLSVSGVILCPVVQLETSELSSKPFLSVVSHIHTNLDLEFVLSFLLSVSLFCLGFLSSFL